MPRLDPEEVRLDTIRPKPGARKNRKRVGRGHGSGLGKTSGRGHKGLGQRSGAKKRSAHEGGQNPIHMRMRKLRGPNRKMSMPFERFRTRTQPVNLSDLDARFDAGAEVTPDSLREAGLATRRHPVKILAKGELTKKLTVRAHGFSATAREKIEAAGGTCELVDQASGPAAPKSDKASGPAASKPDKAAAPKPEKAAAPAAAETDEAVAEGSEQDQA